MPRHLPRYIILALLFVYAGFVQTGYGWGLIYTLLHLKEVPQSPISIKAVTRAIGSPQFYDDTILALNGKPFTAMNQLDRTINAAHPGDVLRMLLSEPGGRAFEHEFRIRSAESIYNDVSSMVIASVLDLLIPLVALGLGFFVAFLRPADRNAWLLLFLLIGFTEVVRRDSWVGNTPAAVFGWSVFWNAVWPFAMVLFAVYFPDRSEFDVKRPWLKYLVLAPCALVEICYAFPVLIWTYNIDQALKFRPLFIRAYFLHMAVWIVAVTTYFIAIGIKSRRDPSADSRRRLRILRVGTFIALAPMMMLVIYSIARGNDLLSGVHPVVAFTSLSFLTLFPLTMAYVIVVGRAMDLRFVIRQSLQYGFVKVGLWTVRAVLAGIAVYLIALRGGTNRVALAAVGGGLLMVRKRSAGMASQWVDRKFFRESYDAEKVLSELATEVGKYVEMAPLLEKVALRISTTMHVPDIVILLREGDEYVTRYSTRPGEPMNLPADGHIAKNLRDRNDALEIYFDKPPLWLRSLTAQELQTLDFMRTQLLLPIAWQDRLTGVISLGPKRSQVPYSEVDIRLLQAVASQMGLAVENSRLLRSLADEAALRERANRELEIAREVQERLFPQKYPKFAGLDCAGYCRPARGVGGDYYDFLELADGTLGIALGDVSGKGIAAALLMASLQASLRGQAMAGVHDLSVLMSNVNTLVYEASTSNRYATFFYAEFNPVTRGMCFVNAGHNPPVILRGGEVIRLEAGGPVVGLLPGARYGQDRVQLEPGDIFISFTDGISEAMNPDEEEWEEDRFIACAQACRRLPAKEMIEHIFRGADEFAGKAQQYDDMTLLVMKLAA